MQNDDVPARLASPGEVADRLGALKERIAAFSPQPDDVTIVAVTKAFLAPIIDVARSAGLADLGENYAQELLTKVAAQASARAGAIAPLADVDEHQPLRWHFIGRLQRNKVRQLAGHVWLWQTVDRVALADEIARRAPGAQILVQVNTTGEDQKGGCPVPEVENIVNHANGLGLTVRGLMTVGPTGEPEMARPGFREVVRIADVLGLKERSMGMSADLNVALAEGATMVRVGSALFGPRQPREP